MTQTHPFSKEFHKEFNRLLSLRRDVRQFLTDPIDPTILDRALAGLSRAPSVGLSEPWRIVMVQSAAARAAVKQNFNTANQSALAWYAGDKARDYAALKLAGLDQAPVHMAIYCDDETPKGHGLGAATMPEMRAYSCVAAVMQLWLDLRTQGIGMGWVSILDPAALTVTLDVPAHWRLIGYFCIGKPMTHDDTPELETMGWETRRLDQIKLIR